MKPEMEKLKKEFDEASLKRNRSGRQEVNGTQTTRPKSSAGRSFVIDVRFSPQ